MLSQYVFSWDLNLNKSIRNKRKINPYNEIMVIYIIPKKTFVLNIAKASKTLAILFAKINVIEKILIMKIPNNSKLKKPNALEITINQNVIPAETAIALNLSDDRSIYIQIKILLLINILNFFFHKLSTY